MKSTDYKRQNYRFTAPLRSRFARTTLGAPLLFFFLKIVINLGAVHLTKPHFAISYIWGEVVEMPGVEPGSGETLIKKFN